MTPLRISVVCPFFNEEAIIEQAARKMLNNLKEQFGERGWELILVDDGSRDRSLEFLLRAVESDGDRVRILSLPWNHGRGRALKTGIDLARGDLIVTTEIDCSWGDQIVKQLANRLEQNPNIDFVVASPHLPGGRLVNVAPSRVLLTKTGNLLIRIFFASHLTMNTGMTRGYRRHVIQPLVAHADGKEFHLEVLLKLLTIGFRADEIPAVLTWNASKFARHKTVKRASSTHIGKTITSHLRFIAIAQPVRYFAWLSLFSLITGVGLVSAAFWMMLIHGPAVFLALLGLIMLLFCLLFLGFSVVFCEQREMMRERWVQMYPRPHPPTSAHAVEIFPKTRAAE
jgi:dolichol-phosphate mannosyltransferase